MVIKTDNNDRLYKLCRNTGCNHRLYLDKFNTEREFQVKVYCDIDCRDSFIAKLYKEMSKRTKNYRMKVKKQILSEWDQ